MTIDEFAFVGSPEEYLQYENFDHESGVCAYDRESSQVHDLLYNLDNSANAEELLKPLCLNCWNDAPQLVIRLENAFANKGAGSELARFIGNKWQTLEDPLAGQWWQDLAKSLIEFGHPAQALSAFENAQASYLIYPTLGHPGEVTDGYYTIWPSLDSFFREIAPFVEKVGDGLDRYLLPRYLELASEFTIFDDESSRSGAFS